MQSSACATVTLQRTQETYRCRKNNRTPVHTSVPLLPHHPHLLFLLTLHFLTKSRVILFHCLCHLSPPALSSNLDFFCFMCGSFSSFLHVCHVYFFLSFCIGFWVFFLLVWGFLFGLFGFICLVWFGFLFLFCWGFFGASISIASKGLKKEDFLHNCMICLVFFILFPMLIYYALITPSQPDPIQKGNSLSTGPLRFCRNHHPLEQQSRQSRNKTSILQFA